MSTAKAFSAADLARARKVGFKKKKPKKPSAKASFNVLSSYIERYNAWVDAGRAKLSDAAKKASDKQKAIKLKQLIKKL